jgi:transcriptional regulator with XRE-family HTH domain
MQRKHLPVTDHPEIQKFSDKLYRDGYLQTQVRSGIAYQIQALREKTGLNQTDFADKIGKKQSFVSRLESTEYGRVSVQTLLDIACKLDVALVVQFTTYPDFLARTADMSSAALQPDTITETLAAAREEKEARGRWTEFRAVSIADFQPRIESPGSSTSGDARPVYGITGRPHIQFGATRVA